MGEWLFFSNHTHVLTAIAREPDLTLREIAHAVGISERATHRIVGELEEHGCLRRIRVGARNHYELDVSAKLRHPLHGHCTVGQVIAALAGPEVRHQTVEPRSGLFDAAFAAASAGIVLSDETGRFAAVNAAFGEILGYTEDELVGRSFREFTHPDDVAADERALAELVSTGGDAVVREKRYVRRDGRVVWVKFRAAPMTDPTTQRRMVVAHVIDIIERKRRDRALAVAEELFRSAFDNAPIGMALVAPDGRWLKVNRALCELTAYPETELLVGSFRTITHPDDLEADLAQVAEVLDGKRRSYQIEKRCYHADGHVIWVLLSVSLVRDSCGEPLYFVTQIQDVTDRKRRADRLRTRDERLTV